MEVLDVVLLVAGLWALLTIGALALASGIGAAAAAADRNARHLLRVQHSRAPRTPRAGLTARR
ncbi:MAG: hypothetical protein JHC84_15065 [Solirubrobacteraceae bacterium]|nr:hypothetical protein [Solirubrobacteraceae bacterium]